MQEEFRKIIFNGRELSVSNLGRVFNSSGIELKSHDKKGYRRVTIHNKGVKKNITVHQLVIMSFLMPDYRNSGLVINHIDKNKTNNRLDNLEVITNRQNCIYSIDKSKTISKYTWIKFSPKSKLKWMSKFKFKGRFYYFGTYSTELEAHLKSKYELEKLISTHGDLVKSQIKNI